MSKYQIHIKENEETVITGKKLSIRESCFTKAVHSAGITRGDHIIIILEIDYLTFSVVLPSGIQKKYIGQTLAFEVQKKYPSKFNELLFDYLPETNSPERNKYSIVLIRSIFIEKILSELPKDVYVEKIFLKNYKGKGFNVRSIQEANKSIKRNMYIRHAIAIVFAAAISFIIVNVYDFIQTNRQIKILETSLNDNSAVYEKCKQVYNDVANDLAVYSFKTTAQKIKLNACTPLYRVAKDLPDTMYLTRVVLENSSVVIEGNSKTENDIFKYLEYLYRAYTNKSAQLEFSEKNTAHNSVQFKIMVE